MPFPALAGLDSWPLKPSVSLLKASLCAVLLAACSREPAASASTAVSGARSPSAELPQGPDLGELPAPMGELRSPPFAEMYARRDSRVDGWETELFNERASAQLSALATLLAQPAELDAQHLAPLLGERAACTDLRPECASVALPGSEFAACRADAPVRDLVRVGPDAVLAALRELAAAFGGERSSAKFKVLSVEPEGDFVRTRAYLHAKGFEADGASEVHAMWELRWTALASESADALPRIVQVEVRHHEELRRVGNEKPLFAEATDAIFAAERTFDAQLRPDLEHWAARIDRTLGMSLIGHEGLALGDADGDGLDDLYVAQPGGLPNRLFVRQSDGTARDTAASAGVDFLDPCRSALFADFDNDGDQDLAVEFDPHVLLLENDGTGKFTERGRASAPSTTSLCAVDYDSDGDLDLYCCGYVLPDNANVTPLPYHDANNGRPNTLLRNDATPAGSAWSFADATRESGLDENNRRFSFAASWEDYDGDGDIDCYVANDFGRNNLYRNEAGTFRDVAASAGVEDMAAGMGVSWGDYDGDGDYDLYVSNMFSSAGERVTYQRQFHAADEPATRAGFQRHARGNSLFRNRGDGTFEDVSERAGVTMGRWSWGSLFVDLDEDGWQDLYVPNGFVTGQDPADL